MTLGVLAWDARSGRFGAAVASSDLAVGARVPWLAAGVGGVLTQHTTDPGLGVRGLELLKEGLAADAVLEMLKRESTAVQARQLAVVDAAGRTASWTGRYVDPTHGFTGSDGGVVVIGNVLATPAVGAAALEAFATSRDEDLAAALVAALKAGEAAGGEGVPFVSAALHVVDRMPYPYVDLRVDRSEDPLAELAELESRFSPRRDEFVTRAMRPDVRYAAAYTWIDPKDEEQR
jgi:uncharacterized Ntn-hydrolase superfamily protein